jgi:hypothetical protein
VSARVVTRTFVLAVYTKFDVICCPILVGRVWRASGFGPRRRPAKPRGVGYLEWGMSDSKLSSLPVLVED